MHTNIRRINCLFAILYGLFGDFAPMCHYYIPAKSSRTLEKPKEVVEVSLEVAVVSLCCGGAGVEVKSLLEPLMEDSRLRSCTIRSPL